MTTPRGLIGLLYTYADVTRASTQRADYAEQLGIPVVWDSGAWSVHTGRATINLDQHTTWVKHRQSHGSAARYIALDVIGNPDRTQQNHKTQRESGARADATLHYGTPPTELNAFTHTTEWVNVGGIAGMTRGHAPIRARAYAESVTTAAHACGLRVHGLGATHPIVTKRVPFDGIDSTYWMSGHRYGLLPLFDINTGDWNRVHYRTRNRTTRTRGWQAMHEIGRWLRHAYKITPNELDNASDERVRDLSILSHRNYANWLAQRHQRSVIVYLAGATGIRTETIEHIAQANQ